jgi:hypothetical protein
MTAGRQFMPGVGALVRVRSLRAVFAPVGAERSVSKGEAVALVALGNAELIRDDGPGSATPTPGKYLRSDLTAEGRHGPARKSRY